MIVSNSGTSAYSNDLYGVNVFPAPSVPSWTTWPGAKATLELFTRDGALEMFTRDGKAELRTREGDLVLQ